MHRVKLGGDKFLTSLTMRPVGRGTDIARIEGVGLSLRVLAFPHEKGRMLLANLRGRLLLIAVVAFLPVLGLMIYAAVEGRRRAATESQAAALAVARFAAVEQHQLIEGTRQLLVGLSQLPEVANHDGPGCSALFAEVRARFPAHANLGAAAPTGEIFCSAVPMPGPVTIADRPYFRRAIDTREFAVGSFLVGRVTGRPALPFGYPAIDRAGRLRAVVFVALDLSWLNHLAADAQLPAGSTLTVLDGAGVVLARYPRAEAWVGTAHPSASLVRAVLTGREEGTAEAPGLDGVLRLYAFRRLPVPRDAGDLYIGVGIPTAVAFADANRALRRNLLGLVVTSLVILAAVWAGGGLFILRPVRALLQATTRLGTGDLRARTGLPYAGELGQLAHAFDAMAANLERREAERGQAEGALRDSALQYRRLVEGSIQGIYIHQDFVIRLANPAFARMFGFERPEAAIGRDIRTLIAPEEHARMEAYKQQRLRGEPAPARYEFQGVRRDGTTLWLENTVSVITWDGTSAILATLFDITERKQLEQQYHQAQKMEAIGQLAGGIAHDFNNLLTVILGRSALLLQRPGLEDSLRKNMELIQSTGQRASALTRQLLTFSRQQVIQPRVLPLRPVIDEISPMLQRLIGEDVELSVTIDPALGSVQADPNQIGQVLLNLVVNARDAMPQGGRLGIEARNVDLDAAAVRGERDARPGAYAVIAVSDTGTGMDEATKARIFEPFFTTKGVGKGTGLGLATVYGIVKQSGGHIAVSTAPGEGTTFTIYLPRVDDAEAEGSLGPAPTRLPRGSETILLVEDEPEVRALTRDILAQLGYRVLEAADPPEARQLADQPHSAIGLLVTDVVMPQMSGPELAAQLKARSPGLRVLYVSGYTNEAVSSRGIAPSDISLLQKPFTPGELARKVREALDTPASGQPGRPIASRPRSQPARSG
jgi:two-component system cell cycle sensor histidine kinase/response regulator CckA